MNYARLRRGLAFAIAIAMGVWFGGGLLLFPDAPISPCFATHYCGKEGQPRTATDYHRFLAWQETMTWVWLPAIIAIYFVQRGLPKE